LTQRTYYQDKNLKHLSFVGTLGTHLHYYIITLPILGGSNPHGRSPHDNQSNHIRQVLHGLYNERATIISMITI